MPSKPHTAPACQPAMLVAPLMLSANRCVASSSTPSLYVKYSSVRASLAPCALLECVACWCVQTVGRLGKMLGKAGHLCALSTVAAAVLFGNIHFVHNLSAACAQYLLSFPHKLRSVQPTLLILSFTHFPQAL
jgi:hypothetical protein